MNGKTIKQLADEFGVSKEAIRKKIDDEFKAAYITKIDGTYYISEAGCDILREKTAQKEPPTVGDNLATTWQQPYNALLETLQHEREMFKHERKILEEQLAVKDRQIEDLNARLAAEQALHAGTMQRSALPAGEEERKRKPSFWSRFFRKKGDVPIED